MIRRPAASHNQRGVILIEALIAILIFSIGILAAVGMQAVAVKNATESRSRSEAAFFAGQLLAQMWLDQNIVGGTNTSNVTSANYNFAGGAPASAPTRLKSWVTQVQAKLPGSTQIVTVTNPTLSSVGTVTGGTVTIEIDWQLPDEATGTPAHRHIVVASIQV